MLFVNLCGLRNSPPDHWQSHWERMHPDLFCRVPQQNWAEPNGALWTQSLADFLNGIASTTEMVLIGHSVGCATIVNWCRDFGTNDNRIKAVLLVAPSDVESPDYPSYISGFTPLFLEQLPFPSWVVASSDDHVVSPQRARYFARAWGSNFTLLEDAGHIESKTGFGRWPAGLKLLSQISGADLA